MRIKRGVALVPTRKHSAPSTDPLVNMEVDLVGGIPINVFEEILKLISINLSVKEACQRIGVSFEYVTKLIENNTNNISDRIAKARLAPKILHLSRIHKADKGWKASAWFLERIDRKNYGRELVLRPEADDGDKQVIRIGGKEISF